MKAVFNILIIIFSVLLLSNCNYKNDELWNEEKIQIREWLNSNGIVDYYEDPNTGYFYYFTDIDSARGGRPNPSSLVEVNYSASVLNNSPFYSTSSNETEFIQLSETITGWQLGFTNFFVNSKVVLILPSRLGYGSKGLKDSNKNYIVPPNSILFFEIHLVEVHPHFK